MQKKHKKEYPKKVWWIVIDTRIADNLIRQIEKIDSRIIFLCSKRGFASKDNIQLLKYKRCYLVNQLYLSVEDKNKR